VGGDFKGDLTGDLGGFNFAAVEGEDVLEIGPESLSSPKRLRDWTRVVVVNFKDVDVERKL